MFKTKGKCGCLLARAEESGLRNEKESNEKERRSSSSLSRLHSSSFKPSCSSLSQLPPFRLRIMALSAAVTLRPAALARAGRTTRAVAPRRAVAVRASASRDQVRKKGRARN